ncbi:tetratricopeptide repeat protein [Chamaesiphon sp.]|uniref:tetratricopeptide repeat protein n=1 Tax=Chamaesiphon sp. TaxID=2814140 RepID=UPI0035942CCA
MSPSTYTTREPIANDILSSANAKYKDRDYLGALTAYTEAIQIDPNNALAICCRGVAHYRLGNDRDAMIDYSRAIAIDPKLAIAYYRRGFLRYLAKDYLGAIADYNKSIELKPDFALAYSNRGYAYRDLYGEQEALLDWRFAAKLFKEQGNITKYQSTMRLIEHIYDDASCASGML